MIRSQADELLFRHAGKSGALTFDATKVDSVQFDSDYRDEGIIGHGGHLGRPVSAKWSRKDGSSGAISFQYMVDASGRSGLLSTKYLKNRTINPNLKNIAHWGYWKRGATFAPGTRMQGAPYFEALTGESPTSWHLLVRLIYRRCERLVLVHTVARWHHLGRCRAKPGNSGCPKETERKPVHQGLLPAIA